MRNKTLTRIIIATLLCALLVNAGRATRVFALAQPIQQIQPIYDTEIIALKDYVEQNLDNPQLDIFFLLGGALAVAQLGAQDAMLESPYPNETSVKEWIINCGIQLYNALIGLVPSGEYFVNIPLVGQPESAVKGIPRSMIKALVAQMMGNAVVARNYSSVDDFLSDDSQHLMPFQRDLQVSINAIWQLQGGPYHWQFDAHPWEGTFNWYTINLSSSNLLSYDNYCNSLVTPLIKANPQYNAYAANLVMDNFGKYDLFINTSTQTAKFVTSSGQLPDTLTINGVIVRPDFYSIPYENTVRVIFNDYNYSSITFDTINELVLKLLSSATVGSTGTLIRTVFSTNSNWSSPNYNDIVDHVYVGTNWINKQEIYNVTGLNVSEDMDDYYKSPDQDVFIDIKDMIENLVNKTSIWDFLIDHLFDIDGNLIIPNFPTFSVDLTPITELLAPPIPVNMNDIALYTDNDYLEEVKERSRKFGETIGQYFVFWHNSDPVTVYVIFGSFIVILVGLFVGTWRHS